MSASGGRRRFFRLPSSEITVARDIDDEIAFHIEERARELEAAGMPAGDARRRAEREFGDVESARSELASIDRTTLRRERRAAWWEALGYDVRQSVRGLRRNVAFTFAVVLTLALGIGVNAAMFGIADRLLLTAPPHVADADDVARVMYTHTPPSSPTTTSDILAYADYSVLRGVAAFSEVAAYTNPGTAFMGRGESAAELRIMGVTASYFPTLGVAPVRGRFFSAAEDAAGDHVLVIGYDVWQNRFGGGEVIGTTVDVEGTTYRIVGVVPRGFNGIDLSPVHAWAPISTVGPGILGDEWRTSRGASWLRVIARLTPGVDREVARQQAGGAFVAAHERLVDDTTAAVLLGSAISARAPTVGSGAPQRTGRIALWLLGVSLLVLVMACVNVANLLLARGMRRRREIGVRVALGVTRLRLAAQVLTETLVIVLIGTMLGLLFAHWAGRAAGALLLPDVDWGRSLVDRRMLGFAAAVALLCALLAGLLPALHAARTDATSMIGHGARGTYGRSTLRAGLVAFQAALSVVLLVGAGLFVRSFDRVSDVPLGFEPDRVLLFQWRQAGVDWDRARVQQLYTDGLQRVRALPQVEAAAITTTAPMTSAFWGGIRVPGMDSVPLPNDRDEGPYFASVSTDYFRTVGARILSGRAFTADDVSGSRPVAIVTDRTARMIWPGEAAVGKCFINLNETDGACREVVGVVEDTRYREVLAAPSMMYFLPIEQVPGFALRTLMVRPRGDIDEAASVVRGALASLEPGLPHVQVTPLDSRVDPQLQPWRLGAFLFTGFGALALLLSTFGLYGVVAYDVVQRRRELGVRVALGASAAGVMRMVIGEAVRVIVFGLVAGLALAGFAARFVEPLLFEVSPRDPAALGGAALMLLTIAVAAAAMPAWRAARVHPTDALRDD